MRDGNRIVQFWGDMVIQHGKVYSQVTLKSLYTVIIWCVSKMFSLANHKMIVTNTGQYMHWYLTDETIDPAVTKKRTGVASSS